MIPEMKGVDRGEVLIRHKKVTLPWDTYWNSAYSPSVAEVVKLLIMVASIAN